MPDYNYGYNGSLPTNSGDNTNFASDITSNIQVVRFYFRTTGTWKTQIKTTGGNMGYLKFIRVYGSAGEGDDACAHLHLSARDNTDTQFRFWDPGGRVWNIFNSGVDLQDGDWHSVVFKVTRNNNTGATGNITMEAWFDDWGMTGDGHPTVTTSPTFGDNFQRTVFPGNWSATFPSTAMGIDIDNIEIWNGVPTDTLTAIIDANKTFQVPDKFELKNSYPNPANSSTVIPFYLAENGFVKIELFNVAGEKVASLVNSYYTTGSYKTQFNSSGLSGGVYFVKADFKSNLNNKIYSFSQKLMLLK